MKATKKIAKLTDKQELWESQYTKGETKGPGWYQLLAQFVENREQVAAQIIKDLDLPKKPTMLELGCGEGELSRSVSALFSKITATDIARNRIALAKKKSKKHPSITFKVQDQDQPFVFKKKFDVITSLSVLEYTLNPYFVIEQISKNTKKGGYFIIEVPNIAFLPERLKLLLGGLPSWPDAIGWQGGRLHAFTFSTLENLLEENGFEITQRTGSGFLRKFRNWWPQLLSGDIILVARKK